MRIMVLFDLPVTTATNKRNYRDFRKFLIKSGFMMVQESVYCKLVQNANVGDLVVENIRKKCPQDGLVQVLRVTEKQYNKMEFLAGKKKAEVIDTDERVIFL